MSTSYPTNGDVIVREGRRDGVSLQTEQIWLEENNRRLEYRQKTQVRYLDMIWNVVREGRRDASAVLNVIDKYGIANDAGISDAISNQTMSHVSHIMDLHYKDTVGCDRNGK